MALGYNRGVNALRLLAATVLLCAASARADDPGIVPLELVVGEPVVVSQGPVRGLLCDDGSLVEATEVKGLPALVGRRPGRTLCSLTNAVSLRVVYRVTVREPGGAAGGTGGTGASR